MPFVQDGEACAASQETTNYHFDVKPSSLRGALERFSQFFIAPLCKADALEREVNAVDNEFSGALLRRPARAACKPPRRMSAAVWPEVLC